VSGLDLQVGPIFKQDARYLLSQIVSVIRIRFSLLRFSPPNQTACGTLIVWLAKSAWPTRPNQ
jgi:hypothetical protein